MSFFEKTSDDMIAARVGGVVHAIIENRGAFILIMSYTDRPISELKRGDFWGHNGKFDSLEAAKADIADMERDRIQIQNLGRVEVPSSARTPWGKSQHATIYADGIVKHSTASHGGFKLDKKRNEMVHPTIRAENGFYEEDCHQAAVAWTFPKLFSDRENKAARNTIINWYPDEYEAITGTQLTEGQSFKRDEKLFAERHANDYVVISATGQADGVHCTATVGGKRTHYEGNTRIDVDEAEFLVPSDEYAARGKFGFVIDPDRHQRLDLDSSPSLRV